VVAVTIRDRLLACSVAVLWGVNFLAIHFSLEHWPPLLLAAVRFLVIAVPAVLLVRRPPVPLRWLLAYGVGFGTLQFVFLYLAMRIGMPTGLASLVLQASAPFTVLLGATLLRERLAPRQGVGIGLAVLGLVAIAAARAQAAALLPVVLTLLGALGWAFGNLANRLALRDARGPVNPMSLVLWMSVVPPLPLLVASWTVEGPDAWGAAFAAALTPAGVPGLLGLAYTVVLGTLVGSGIWTMLMRRHPAGVVAPYSLLVPVVGMSAAWAVLGERPSGLAVLGALVVIAGAGAATMVRGPATLAPPAAATPRVAVASAT